MVVYQQSGHHFCNLNLAYNMTLNVLSCAQQADAPPRTLSSNRGSQIVGHMPCNANWCVKLPMATGLKQAGNLWALHRPQLVHHHRCHKKHLLVQRLAPDTACYMLIPQFPSGTSCVIPSKIRGISCKA